MIAERAWLKWVRRAAQSGGAAAGVRLGIGDDAALLRPRRGWEVAVTTDLFIDGVHFLRRWDEPEVCGQRLAVRALSDLAAMGAEAMAVFVSSAYPGDLEPAWARRFYRGLMRASGAAGASLAGGDVSAMPADCAAMVFDVVGVGQIPAGAALRRDGARAGDRLCVSGVLGEAARGRALAHGGGRALAHGGGRARTAEERRALERHRHPQARLALGRALRGRATAAIDISDGLATDLHHLCEESGAGAEVRAGAIPGASGREGLRLALYGGEDYELLFTLPRGRRLPAEAVEIGTITNDRRIRLVHDDGRREDIPDRGWEHFQGEHAGPRPRSGLSPTSATKV